MYFKYTLNSSRCGDRCQTDMKLLCCRAKISVNRIKIQLFLCERGLGCLREKIINDIVLVGTMCE